MIFKVLGPLEVMGTVKTGSPVRRAILIAFLLRAGQSIGVAELSGLLWDTPPNSAVANIRTHLTGLRRDLDEAAPGLGARVKTYRGTQVGYGMQVTADELDLVSFTRAAQHGRSLLLRGLVDQAASVLEDAMALWRGPFGQDLPATRWFNAHAAGLNNARFHAYEGLFTARILANRTEMLSYEIESALAESPYRQRLWELLSAVHCIEGDAAGALTVIRRCQQLFAEDLGLDLPPSLGALRTAALSWDREQALRLVASGISAGDHIGTQSLSAAS
ncbi:DNA-binding SARP family transcriptional activator [Krasilnikovia cinnamomea]|uniref:DNA-binding SARP family transcriptional activator n=1 Tax=Krasilnikovia cinnamomea TaxID=349313 RepID=A0A4Q7ZLX1_9ACTN|nr:BTAD domain-containing putative transcriptional regulator [Krasilnikovia cinnamomea]RZU51335.1 DNA-binding SARP family transcriptional activator [Krasilnikovia cinnamomea]